MEYKQLLSAKTTAEKAEDDAKKLDMSDVVKRLGKVKTMSDQIKKDLDALKTDVANLKEVTSNGFEQMAMGGDQLHPKGSYKNAGQSCTEIKASYPSSASGY